MKKCGIFFLSLLLFTLYSCRPKEGNETMNAEKAENIVEYKKDTAIIISDTIPLDSHDAASPVLCLNIILESLELESIAATERAIKAVSYSLAGEEHKDLATACKAYTVKIISEYEELRPDFINTRRNYEGAFWPNHEFTIKGICEREKKGYVNYILFHDEYQGGAHPNSYITTFVFDTTDGHEITLDEIMKEGYEEALLQIITQELIEHFKVSGIEELDKRIFGTADLFVSKNILVYNGYIRFIYNRYDIAPYAAGDIIIDITYEKLKDILK